MAKSFIDIMYDKINEIIGGDNKNQFFCMSLPGVAIVPEMYKYDYKNSKLKPPSVEANESKLVNKMFDACQVTGSDNGRSLPQQYQSALNMLTPKLNAKIAQAKNILREMLMMPYPYDFGTGLEKDLTLQQVFYRLYDEWIERKQLWSKVQSEKKAELTRKYPGNDSESNVLYQNEYLTWYQDVADGYLESLNGQMGKMLGVFSPNDMKIIEGILDSGSGAEIEEAREILLNSKKANPNGGYTYHVTLYPENWFELFDNSFEGIDLLQTPAVLSEQMSKLSSQKINLISQINKITDLLPQNTELTTAINNVNDAKKALEDAAKALTESYGSGAATIFRTALDIANSNGAISTSVLNRLVSCEPGVSKEKEGTSIIKALTDSLSQNMENQSKLLKASQNLVDLQLKVAENKNLAKLKSLIQPLQTRLENLNNQISELQKQIDDAVLIQNVNNSDNDKSEVAPFTAPKGFTQIVLEESFSTMKTETSMSSSASTSTYGANLFFGGYSRSSSSSQSAFDSFTKNTSCKIQIGMSIAKVMIDRAWFNPGLFLLSKDMCNVTTQKFAPANIDYDGFSKERFNEMNKCVFPCFPTAFVVARDVTFKLVAEESFSDEHAMSMEKHASSGGGFLFFRGNSSTSSSSSSSCASVSSSDKCITVHFTDPQIMGYYLEATPADKSTYIDDISKSTDVGYVTVIDFVKACKVMLEEHRKMTQGGELSE